MPLLNFNRIRKPAWLAALLLGLVPAAGLAAGGSLLGPSASGDNFLPPEQAFQFSAEALGPGRIQFHWVIARGYYLYRDRMKFQSLTPGVSLAPPDFPAGDAKDDEYFGKQVVYHQVVSVPMAVTVAAGAEPHVRVKLSYQGCAEAGLCYPPQPVTVDLDLRSGASAGGATAAGGQAAAGTAAGDASASCATAVATNGPGASGGGSSGSSGNGFVSEQNRGANLIRTGNLLFVLGFFFLSGLLLSYTPCCLPMVPILSALIAGQGAQVTARKAFLLSLAYVLGMALTYTAAGAATAAAGKQAQAFFQQPWIIVLFTLMFLVMAAAMFGWINVQLPAFIQSRAADASAKQRAGTYVGVAVMGALSSLIVTACIAPPLVATLIAIGEGGAIGRGAAALFTMAIGMGTPLLLVGASQGRLLPRVGPWMDSVKQLFGVMMLAVAAWMASRLFADRWALALYGLAALAGVVVLWRFSARGWGKPLARAAATACAIYGALLMVGSAQGGTDPLRPWHFGESAAQPLQFTSVGSVADLDRAVAAAARSGRGAMLDFYADWCASCKEMERYSFSDPSVQRALTNTVLLRADVTASNEAQQALLHRFGIYGPPTIAFFTSSCRERSEYRVVGYMKAAEFAQHVRAALTAGG